MAEIVNLNKVRKARAKAEQGSAAAINRAKAGRTKAERAADTTETERRDHLLDGAKRDD